MNTHKHARLTFARRFEMVKQMTLEGLDAVRAAAAHGVTAPTARKWLGRYLAGGEAALADASSKPARSPRAIDSGKVLLILELRKRRMLQSRIARSVGVSASTVSRVLTRAGMSKLSDLVPAEPIVRYEHEAPGDLLHIDTKKLGRIVRPSHRVTGNRRDSVDGAGWETLFVAIDDHARLAFTAMHPDEKQAQAVLFLRNAVAYYARLGITVRRLLTDRPGVPLARLPGDLRRARYQAQLHAALPAADQRKSRTVHPVRVARMGLRLDLPELSPTNRCPGKLAAPLQLAPPAQRYWRHRTYVQNQLVKKQPLDVHGRPRFAKLSVCERRGGEDCTRTSGLFARALAVPDGFCWLAPQSFSALQGALSRAGYANHGLTCHAITV
ncbi:Transposase [Variovorax sp. OK212]|nr:Transposase [Variovorax sp. OK202]SFE62067.1 Transposase [Variovorax sp. OK212]